MPQRKEICKIIKVLNEVRESSECNMFDLPCVKMMLLMMGEDEVAEWITEHRKEYAQLIFTGKIGDVDYRECLEG